MRYHLLICETERLTDIENRLVVAKGEKGWGRRGMRAWLCAPPRGGRGQGPLQPARTCRHRAMAHAADTHGEDEPVASSRSVRG